MLTCTNQKTRVASESIGKEFFLSLVWLNWSNNLFQPKKLCLVVKFVVFET